MRLLSADHKRIGMATMVTAVAYFFGGGVMALVMRGELARPGMQFLSYDTYNQLFTLHGSTMLLIFAPAVVMGLGIYMVPLQIGASEVVWPRLAALAYWLYAPSGLIMWAGFLVKDGAARSGWHAFYPLTSATEQPSSGMDLWIVGVFLSQLAVLLFAIVLLATIARRRAPGMTLWRMPFFTWSMVATIFMAITTYPIIEAALVLLFIDRHVTSVFTLPGGAVTWQYLFWFYAHPLVYVIFFPVMAAVAETFATFSRRRLFGHRTSVIAVLIFAALSSSVWGHHMFEQQTVDNRYFAFTTTSISIPASIEYFAFVATMWGGRVRLFATPMLFAMGFAIMFLVGGLSGVFVASPPIDYDVHDTYLVVAHFHFTVFGGTVWGLMCAIYYWFPKWTGRKLGDTLGRWHAGLMLVGTLATFVPWFVLGMLGMRREVADYPDWAGWATWNTVSTVGAGVMGLSFVLFAINVWRSLRHGELAGNDPWDGHTLEWMTTSPPPRGNFERLPPVLSEAPLLDLRTAPEPVA
ncbi:MAG: ctaD2 [Solirubrobacteraceae bacterium]|nr:ctaD2 [Solirubrobacteraceae bacterium]